MEEEFINGLAYGRNPTGDWVPLVADSQGRLLCHINADAPVIERETFIEIERYIEIPLEVDTD